MSEQDNEYQKRKDSVKALAEKFREAKNGDTTKWHSAEDLHLALVALKHFEESVKYEYALMPTYLSGCGCPCGGAKDFEPDKVVWGSERGAERCLFEAVMTETGRRITEQSKHSFEHRIVKRRRAGPLEEL